MKRRHPIRLHAALRGGPRVGAAVMVPLAVNPQTTHRAGSRFGGLPAPI